MKKQRAFVRILCGILVALMILSVTIAVIPAKAATKAELRSEISELEDEQDELEEKIAALEEQIETLDSQRSGTLEKKAALDERNALAQEELDVITEQIGIIEGYMANRQLDLENARAMEAEQEEALMARLRAMEENSDLSYIQIIFQAASFSDLLTRIDLINEVMEYDEELWASYISARENVELLEAEAAEMFAENEANRQELETKKAQLEADIQAANDMIAELESTLEGYLALRAEEEADMEAVKELIEEKEAELDELIRQEQAAAGPGNGGYTPGGSGPLLWPSYTALITSYYGYRIHPEYGDWRMHNGVDIGAAGGTAIWAPADGVVTVSAKSGGYGNYVSIAHDNGYSTLCAHMNSRAVSAGQRVSQGQIIGYVGSTGVSTGNHIHFEVYSGGARIDPLSVSYIYA